MGEKRRGGGRGRDGEEEGKMKNGKENVEEEVLGKEEHKKRWQWG